MKTVLALLKSISGTVSVLNKAEVNQHLNFPSEKDRRNFKFFNSDYYIFVFKSFLPFLKCALPFL